MRRYYINSLLSILMQLLTCIAAAQKSPTGTQYASIEKVVVESTLPNIDSTIKKALKKNIELAVAVRNGAGIGRYTVAAQCIVDKEGNVSDVKALTTHGYGMEEGVMKALRKSPRWEPASKDNKIERGYGKFAVTFLVQDETISITSKTPYTLYANTDNEISVHVKNVKIKLIKISLSGGTITRTAGENYLIKVKEGSRDVLMTIKKRRRKVADVRFEVE